MTHELDCSPAAAMMIERMQTHPDDFKYGGKLYYLHHMSENGDLSKRDRVALNEAHDKYIKEPNLMVWVLETLMKPDAPKEEDGGHAVTYNPATYNPTYNPATNHNHHVKAHTTLLNKFFGRGE